MLFKLNHLYFNAISLLVYRIPPQLRLKFVFSNNLMGCLYMKDDLMMQYMLVKIIDFYI